MTAPALAKASLYRSGWCGTGTHRVCAGTYAGATCTCPCHHELPGMEGVNADAVPAKDGHDAALLPPAAPAPSHPGPTPDLGDALTLLTDGIGALDLALPAFDGQPADWCDLLGRVRLLRQRLAQLEALVENRTAQAMPHDQLEWEGGTAERRWGKDRREWQHDDLTRAVAAAVIPPLAVDQATGEVDRDLAALLHQAVAAYADTNRPSWRVTALKPLGIDPDEYATVVAGRTTVQVHLAEPAA